MGGAEPRRNVVAIIPARVGSTRFPAKPLARIAGVPMIARVVTRVLGARSIDEVWVATDDPEIGQTAERAGARVYLSDRDFATGTDRVAAAAAEARADLVVNVQGDEPLIDPRSLDALVEALGADGKTEVATLVFPLTREEDFQRPDVVKAVVGADGFALYFSRAPVPCRRDRPGCLPAPGIAWKHLGVYAFRRGALASFAAWPPSPLEQLEGLEQLRLLERGLRIRAVEALSDAISVDRPEDIARVEAILGREPQASGAPGPSGPEGGSIS